MAIKQLILCKDPELGIKLVCSRIANIAEESEKEEKRWGKRSARQVEVRSFRSL